MRLTRTGGWLALLLAGTSAPLAGQRLTLPEALQRAGQSAWANRVADAEARAAAGQAIASLRGILPTIRFETGYVATTDPLAAFGFTLRQRAVTPAAFAPDRLNDPGAAHNIGAGLVLEQPLVNADAWLGRKSAASARDAAEAQAGWTRATTALEVTRGYWGAVLAMTQVRTLLVADSAAASHRRQAEALVRQGLATQSDAMLARVKAGEIHARLIAAESQARLARAALSVVMGAPGDTAFTLPDSIPLPAAAAPDSVARPRGDVLAATRARAAAEADARRAALVYLPRVNGFGRVDWNSPDSPFGGRSAWTVGVMLTWTPFSGGSELGDLRASRARRDAARAAAEAAEAQASLETRAARENLEVALARLAIAVDAVQQATEAHRIVGKKYDGGLATVTELFDAAAAETASELARDGAAFDALVARADLDRATGKEMEP
jgi:outer membrane protein TolC